MPIQSCVHNNVEHFLYRCSKGCTKKFLQKVNLLHIDLELRALNYQTQLYVDGILKCRGNCYKIHFSVNNSCNFKAISRSNILKQIYKTEK